jgi:hypothetical protein
MVAFIDQHRDTYGVEPICAVLPIAPSTYFVRKAQQQATPTTRSPRRQRDDDLRAAIQRVWDDNDRAYGPRKVWKQLRRDGHRVARCTVERLMTDLAQALQHPDTRTEAAEAIRGLIDAIVLTPAHGALEAHVVRRGRPASSRGPAEAGHHDSGLQIELKGNLAAMLSAAQNATRSPETGDLELQIAVVAGARNPLNLEFAWTAA